MSQNQLISILTVILLVVIGASAFVLFGGSRTTDLTNPDDISVPTNAASGQFDLSVLEQQAYQLLNKQLIREGALPVKPPVTVGKANPFL